MRQRQTGTTRGIWLLVLVGVVVALFVLGVVWTRSRGRLQQPAGSAPEELTFALALQPPSALVMIALDEGHFEAEGLRIITKEYVSGKRALLGMLAGEVDLASTAEVPVVFQSFERDDFAIVATIGAVDSEQRIVARQSRGISKAGDLAGKHIATQKGSAVHFFLHMFLMKHDLSEKDVEISFMRAEELPIALADGRIDAFSMREPYVSQAKKLLGDDATVFGEPGIYFRTEQLVVRDEFLVDHKEAVRRFVAALMKAKASAREHPPRAEAIVARRLGVTEEALKEFWQGFELRLTLDQSLFVSLEDEARWAIENDLVEAGQAPNFLDFIYADALEAVDPHAVTIIHRGERR